jgi:hypothetical protein
VKLDKEELYKYAYIKKPLNEIYKDPSSVPQEFIMDWYKDSYDYQRIHSDEELKECLRLTRGIGIVKLKQDSSF